VKRASISAHGFFWSTMYINTSAALGESDSLLSEEHPPLESEFSSWQLCSAQLPADSAIRRVELRQGFHLMTEPTIPQ